MNVKGKWRETYGQSGRGSGAGGGDGKVEGSGGKKAEGIQELSMATEEWRETTHFLLRQGVLKGRGLLLYKRILSKFRKLVVAL